MRSKLIALAVSTMPLAAPAMGQHTTIDHKDGGRTEVTTDKSGTRAERDGGAGGSHNAGGTDRETHDRMVREHTERGDKVTRDNPK